MFTKQDFTSYYNQILDIERKMEETYQYLYDQITHPEYRNIFAQLVHEERMHQAKVDAVVDLFR
ncbi:MAG: hypothetical protein WCH07_06370 [Deltaproteobacteria bacterium]